jgi:hypothetical protein
MAISSMDQLVTAFSGGKFLRSDWSKLAPPTPASATAGTCFSTIICPGSPGIGGLIGATATLAHQEVSESTTVTATSTGSTITGTNLFTVGTLTSTTQYVIGMVISGTSVTAGTTLTSLSSGTGGSGSTFACTVSTNATSTAITGTGYSGGIPHGGNVSTDVKHIVNASLFSGAATCAPAVWILVDVLASYTIFPVTTPTEQTFTGSAAWPRYADGKGVQAFYLPTVTHGLGTSTITITYTNTADASKSTPGILPSMQPSATAGLISYSGTGSGRYNPFLPLAAGDQGIKSVQKITIATSQTSGRGALVICKPLLTLPITTQGVAGERDLVNQLPSMPRVYDGAVLHWVYLAGAAVPANTSYSGHLDFAWG